MRTLEALLAVLDEDDATEIVLTPGQPVTVRRAGGYSALDDDVLDMTALDQLIAGSVIADEVESGGGGPMFPVKAGGRSCRADVQAFGAQVIVRLLRDPSAPRPAKPAPPPAFDLGDTAAPEFELPSTPALMPVAPAMTSVSFSRAPRPETIQPASGIPDAEVQGTAAPRAEVQGTAAPRAEVQGTAAPRAEVQGTAAPVLQPVRQRAVPISTAPPVGRADGGEAALPRLEPLRPAAAPGKFVELVEAAKRARATDLHVVSGLAPVARTVEGLTAIGVPLDEATVDGLLRPMLTVPQRLALDRRGYVDTAIDLGAVARLRANISRTRLGLKGTFRLVMSSPPTLEQLGLPADLAKVTSYHQGFVVIAGPNGHGKTATLAALIDLINSTRAQHILMVEDPVEIIHPRKKSVISQREVGSHTRSFASALKASLREDPDVIVIGELRDRETVEIALTAAETGHLVIATMSTPSAAKTLDRLIDMFPPDDRPQVRASLAAALRFVVAQRLLPAANGQGLVAAIELLTGVLPLAALIRDDKLFQIGSLQQRGRAFGMIRLDSSLAELVRAGKITEEVALRAAESRKELANVLRPGAASVATAPTEPLPSLMGRLGGIFGKKEKD